MKLLDATGQALATVAHIPTAQADGEAVVAAVLTAAQRERLTVVEVMSGNLRETLEVWYGGRPLLAHPDEAIEAQSAALLRQLGHDVRADDDELRIVEEHPRTHPVLAATLFLLLAPLAPVFFAHAGGGGARFACSRRMCAARRPHPRSSWCAPSPSARTRSAARIAGTRPWSTGAISAESPSRRPSATTAPSPASLRLIGRARTVTLPVRRAAEAGRALRDLLVAATLRLRRAKPEFGLLGEGPVPAHCPFCAALYLMEPGSRCPSCGAHTGVALQG